MIIDRDVKWPHASKVTADTAANNTVSRQRREWRSEGGHVKMAFMVYFHEINCQIDFPSSQALSQHPCPQAGGAPWKNY